MDFAGGCCRRFQLNHEWTRRGKAATEVAQTSKSAVSWVSKPANRAPLPGPADLEIGDTAGLETCATPARRLVSGGQFILIVWRIPRNVPRPSPLCHRRDGYRSGNGK